MLERIISRHRAKVSNDQYSKMNTPYKRAKMVDPGEFAAIMYGLKNNVKPSSLRGDELEKAVASDHDVRMCLEAKRGFDDLSLQTPKASELHIKWVTETVKASKGNLAILDKAEREKLGWITSSAVAFLKYQRALMATRSCQSRKDGGGFGWSDSYEFARKHMRQNQALVVPFQNPSQDDGINTTDPNYLRKAESVAKNGPFIKAVCDGMRNDPAWANLAEFYANSELSSEPYTDYLDKPTISTKEAECFFTVDELTSTLEKQYDGATSAMSREHLLGLANFRDWKAAGNKDIEALTSSMYDSVEWYCKDQLRKDKATLSKEVPALLIYFTAGGAGLFRCTPSKT